MHSAFRALFLEFQMAENSSNSRDILLLNNRYYFHKRLRQRFIFSATLVIRKKYIAKAKKRHYNTNRSQFHAPSAVASHTLSPTRDRRTFAHYTSNFHGVPRVTDAREGLVPADPPCPSPSALPSAAMRYLMPWTLNLARISIVLYTGLSTESQTATGEVRNAAANKSADRGRRHSGHGLTMEQWRCVKKVRLPKHQEHLIHRWLCRIVPAMHAWFVYLGMST